MRISIVAKTEFIEQRRQPAMLVVLAFNYIFWGGIFLFGLGVLAFLKEDPRSLAMFESQASTLGICDGESAYHTMLKLMNSTFGAVLYTNLSLFVAIMSGYSVINDRLQGTLPFLMLAPLSRFQLLLGKLLGALFIPVILHFIFVGSITLIASQLEIIAPFSAQFGSSTAWWIAFILGAPLSGFFIGSIGTVVSALSNDVRTSMQYTSFLIGIFSLICGYVLYEGIPAGALTELGYAFAVGILGVFTLGIGSKIISRDLR